MKRIMTNDGSISFYSETFKEAYHSVSGAISEAFGKYIEPSNFDLFFEHNDKAVILDVCFGLGYNSVAAIEKVIKLKKSLVIYALESDINIIKQIPLLPDPVDSYFYIKQLASRVLEYFNKSDKEQIIELRKGPVFFKFILGDATKTIDLVDGKLDFIFHDPFSPRKNPDLWTADFFQKISTKCKKGAILTTYSCASLVRKNLVKAGFKVKDGPSIGRRAPSTIAEYAANNHTFN